MMLKDWPPGSLLYTLEAIGDEYREVFYVRGVDSEPCRFPNNVRIGRFGVAQGSHFDEDRAPRYLRKRDIPCYDPGEADGRIECYNIKDGGSMWATLVIPTDWF